MISVKPEKLGCFIPRGNPAEARRAGIRSEEALDTDLK
jgi:hypothetical protein